MTSQYSSQSYSSCPHSIFYHICLLHWCFCSLCHSAHVCAAGDQQAATQACPGSVPLPGWSLPCSTACSQRGCGHEGGMVTSIRELGPCCPVSSEERSPQQACRVLGFTVTRRWIPMGKIAVMWLAVPQINDCDRLHCFRQKMATCCCSEIVLSAKHTAPLDPFMPCKGGRNPG